MPVAVRCCCPRTAWGLGSHFHLRSSMSLFLSIPKILYESNESQNNPYQSPETSPFHQESHQFVATPICSSTTSATSGSGSSGKLQTWLRAAWRLMRVFQPSLITRGYIEIYFPDFFKGEREREREIYIYIFNLYLQIRYRYIYSLLLDSLLI